MLVLLENNSSDITALAGSLQLWVYFLLSQLMCIVVLCELMTLEWSKQEFNFLINGKKPDMKISKQIYSIHTDIKREITELQKLNV